MTFNGVLSKQVVDHGVRAGESRIERHDIHEWIKK